MNKSQLSFQSPTVTYCNLSDRLQEWRVADARDSTRRGPPTAPALQGERSKIDLGSLILDLHSLAHSGAALLSDHLRGPQGVPRYCLIFDLCSQIFDLWSGVDNEIRMFRTERNMARMVTSAKRAALPVRGMFDL